MNIIDVNRAKIEFTKNNPSKIATMLNLSDADAIHFLNELIGNGALNRDLQDQAIEAINTSKKAVIKFLTDNKILGLKITIYPVVL